MRGEGTIILGHRSQGTRELQRPRSSSFIATSSIQT